VDHAEQGLGHPRSLPDRWRPRHDRERGSQAGRGKRLCATTCAVSTKAARAWTALWIVLALVLVVRATGRPNDRGVIIDSLEFGRRLVHGEDVYAPWQSGRNAPVRPLHAPFPPSFGLLMAPFAGVEELFGLRAARCAWGLLQVAALVVIARCLRRLPTGTSPPSDLRWNWLMLAMLVIAARFVLRDTAGGGGNLINVAWCLLAYVDAEQGRQRRAGLWLGISLLTKPTQALLLPVFWLLGHRRAVSSTTATVAGGVLLSLLLLRFDTAPWLRWLEGSLALARQQDAFAVPELGFPPFEWMNQSLRCAMARWVGTVPPDLAARVPHGVMPGLGLSVTATAWATRLCSLGALAALMLRAHQRRASSPPNTDGTARTMVFAAALTLSLLLSPISWKAHHVALLPALLLLLRRASEQRCAAARAMLAAFLLLCALGSDVLSDAIDELGNSLYLVTIVDLAWFVILIHWTRRDTNLPQ
jgi:hypothetical protein